MSLFPRFVSQEIRPFFQMLNEPLFYAPSAHHTSRRAFQPNFDVHETKDAYELSGEVPGVNDKSNLDIQFVDAQTLVVKGKVERHRSYGPSSGENTPTEDSTATATEAAQKPPKPTVEDEAEASTSSAATGSENTTVAKTTPQEVKKAETNGRKVWVSERMSGEFQRSFSFPATIDQEAVKASLKDGILSIVVPKRELKGTRKISVE